MIAGHRSDKT